MGRKKFRIATVILLIVCMIVLCMQNVKYGNMYNLADEEILADYPEVHHTTFYSSSILDNREFEARMLLMCGNSSICNLTSTQQATMELSVERNWGKGRLLLKNQESGEICSVPLENGDTAVIDFEGFENGVAFEGGKSENYNLVIGSNTFIPGFEDQLVGKKAGEEVEVNVTFPETYHAENLAGKPVVFNVKVIDVKV